MLPIEGYIIDKNRPGGEALGKAPFWVLGI